MDTQTRQMPSYAPWRLGPQAAATAFAVFTSIGELPAAPIVFECELHEVCDLEDGIDSRLRAARDEIARGEFLSDDEVCG